MPRARAPCGAVPKQPGRPGQREARTGYETQTGQCVKKNAKELRTGARGWGGCGGVRGERGRQRRADCAEMWAAELVHTQGLAAAGEQWPYRGPRCLFTPDTPWTPPERLCEVFVKETTAFAARALTQPAPGRCPPGSHCHRQSHSMTNVLHSSTEERHVHHTR